MPCIVRLHCGGQRCIAVCRLRQLLWYVCCTCLSCVVQSHNFSCYHYSRLRRNTARPPSIGATSTTCSYFTHSLHQQIHLRAHCSKCPSIYRRSLLALRLGSSVRLTQRQDQLVAVPFFGLRSCAHQPAFTECVLHVDLWGNPEEGGHG